MFTYPHLNTPINQWERAYCLEYFIKYSKDKPKIAIQPEQQAALHKLKINTQLKVYPSKNAWLNISLRSHQSGPDHRYILCQTCFRLKPAKIAEKYVFHTVFHLNTALVNCKDLTVDLATRVEARSHRKPAKIYLASFWFTFARHLARLRRRRAYAPTSNTASHDNHKKITSWVSFDFPWCLWGPGPRPFRPRSSAIKTNKK